MRVLICKRTTYVPYLHVPTNSRIISDEHVASASYIRTINNKSRFRIERWSRCVYGFGEHLTFIRSTGIHATRPFGKNFRNTTDKMTLFRAISNTPCLYTYVWCTYSYYVHNSETNKWYDPIYTEYDLQSILKVRDAADTYLSTAVADFRK